MAVTIKNDLGETVWESGTLYAGDIAKAATGKHADFVKELDADEFAELIVKLSGKIGKSIERGYTSLARHKAETVAALAGLLERMECQDWETVTIEQKTGEK